MSRFYFERSSGQYLIYDRQWSNSRNIAVTDDVNVAEMICAALNKFWEKPQ